MEKELTTEASIRAYSKSGLRARSCEWRAAALRTSLKRARWMVCVSGTCSSVIDSMAARAGLWRGGRG